MRELLFTAITFPTAQMVEGNLPTPPPPTASSSSLTLHLIRYLLATLPSPTTLGFTNYELSVIRDDFLLTLYVLPIYILIVTLNHVIQNPYTHDPELQKFYPLPGTFLAALAQDLWEQGLFGSENGIWDRICGTVKWVRGWKRRVVKARREGMVDTSDEGTPIMTPATSVMGDEGYLSPRASLENEDVPQSPKTPAKVGKPEMREFETPWLEKGRSSMLPVKNASPSATHSGHGMFEFGSPYRNSPRMQKDWEEEESFRTAREERFDDGNYEFAGDDFAPLASSTPARNTCKRTFDDEDDL